jgi:hypothetical protein
MAAITLAALAVVVAVVGCAQAKPHHRYYQSTLHSVNSPPDQWFTQNVDHFDSAGGTWLQRFQVNDTWYQPGGPLFLMLGGEGPANGGWIGMATAVMLYSEEHSAVVAQLGWAFIFFFVLLRRFLLGY